MDRGRTSVQKAGLGQHPGARAQRANPGRLCSVDPAQRRDQALQFFSATYYQKAAEFSDILTATFPPGSPGAATIREAQTVRLRFEAYTQVYDLTCKVWRLAAHNPLYRSTIAHNQLFNPTLAPDTEVLGFEPNWDASSSDPEVR